MGESRERRGRPAGSRHFRALLAACESDDEPGVRPHGIADARAARTSKQARSAVILRDENALLKFPSYFVGSQVQQQLGLSVQKAVAGSGKAEPEPHLSIFQKIFRSKRNVAA